MRNVRRRMWSALAIGAIALGMVGTQISTGVGPAAADSPGRQTPLPNPPMVESCGADVVLVLDASGSISSSHAVDDVRDAADSFLDALADTGSTARVLQFASLSEQLAGQAEVTAASMQPGGSFRNAINRYYNPIPPRPGNVNIYQYDGHGDPQNSSNYRQSNGSNQYTNWDQSLDQAGDPQTKPVELVVYVTDGDPTAFDFNQPGDPFDAGPPPDVAINTGGDASQTTLDRAVQEANIIKAAGSRMLAVGVGSAVTGNQSSRDRLIEIAGPQTVTDSGLSSVTSINQVDVALVKDFNKLAAFLRGVVNELCTPSLAIRKLAQTPGSAQYSPAPNWSITVQPSVTPSGTYRWILPDTDAAQVGSCGNPSNPNDQAARTCLTNSTGIAAFQWEPNPAENDTSAVITEALQPGYTAGRPTDTDWKCTLKNNDGTEETQSGSLGTPPLGFTLNVDPNQIITCVVYNSFNYAPQIAIVKSDAPTQVRGDLSPPANTVTSTFTVTNPGNTPLANVKVTDNRCSPTYVSGDTNGDALLAQLNGESWIFRCTRNMTSSAGNSPVPVTNIAEAAGTDPTGERVSATANATVTVFAPAITLTKSANPTEVEVGTPTDVTYTYVATNTGNMTLNNVAVSDLGGPTATCSPVAPASVTLAPAASATFTCTATLSADDPTDTFVNNATVTGDPVFPDNSPAPPVVTAHATAVVTAFQAGIELTKVANHDVVLPGTAVTYTYQVKNTGTVDLVRTGTAPMGSSDPRDGWITDILGPTGTCSPVVYDSGDDGDNVLNPDEAWTYLCTTIITGTVSSVRNTAMVVAAVVGGGGSTLTVFAPEIVDVVAPQLVLEKTAVHPTVLDPSAPAVLGPDVPLRTPAVYQYILHNTGNVAVRNVVLTDLFPARTVPAQLNCPVEAVPPAGFNVGDINANSVLDPGEAWEFQCVLRSIGGGHALTKADSDVPPGFNPLVPSTVTNTATAVGEAFFMDGNTEVTGPVTSNSATAQVRVISPNISMTKIPCTDNGAGALTCASDLLVRPGTDVTYVYGMTNTGDTDLGVVGALDDSCDVVAYESGDVNANDLIDGGLTPETWEYRCTTEVNRPSPVVNEAGVLAVDTLGNKYLATAEASVRIFEPAIDLTKTVSADLVPVGSTVTYTFKVTNAGTVTDDGLPAEVVLSNIALLDVSQPANPSCTNPTFVPGGDTNSNGLLDFTPAEVWTYQCTGVINQPTVDAAVVTGTDIHGGLVTDLDAATVTPFVTGINITKVANPTQVPEGGGLVTYSYEVTNTGNVPLANVGTRVTDDKCPTVVGVMVDGFNIGDFDQNGVLTGEQDLFETGGPEVWQFTCVVNIAVDTLNTVTVIGTPVQPVPDVTIDQSADAVERLLSRAESFQVLAPDVTDQAQAHVIIIPSPTTTTLPPTTTTIDSGGQLPTTGSNTLPVMYISLLTLVAGYGVVRASRRRPRTSRRS